MNPFDGVTLDPEYVFAAVGVAITFLIAWKPLTKAVTFIKKGF